jgi:hypothetical protein
MFSSFALIETTLKDYLCFKSLRCCLRPLGKRKILGCPKFDYTGLEEEREEQSKISYSPK